MAEEQQSSLRQAVDKIMGWPAVQNRSQGPVQLGDLKPFNETKSYINNVIPEAVADPFMAKLDAIRAQNAALSTKFAPAAASASAVAPVAASAPAPYGYGSGADPIAQKIYKQYNPGLVNKPPSYRTSVYDQLVQTANDYASGKYGNVNYFSPMDPRQWGTQKQGDVYTQMANEYQKQTGLNWR